MSESCGMGLATFGGDGEILADVAFIEIPLPILRWFAMSLLVTKEQLLDYVKNSSWSAIS